MKKKCTSEITPLIGQFRKLLLIMRLSFVIILSSLIQVSASTYSQSTKLNIKLENASIKDLFKDIKKQSEFTFVYNVDDIEDLKKINCDFSQSTVEEILDYCLKGKEMTYEVRDKVIVIVPREKLEIVPDEPTEQLQKKTITGKVSDDKGEPLPGVSIVVKGTTIGITTDIDGNYTLEIPDEAEVLVFSFIGMETQEVEILNQATINIAFVSSVVGLEDVVVTALGISREKKSLGYSVAEVDGESLQMVAQENVLNSLSGKVAGVQISSTGGAGSSVSMVIRGASSLTSDNQPLFVVDGIPMNNTLNNIQEIGRENKPDYGNAISDLNAQDIESISVLKGPSAAALYGSRAGNGVVLITTKSGKKSKGLGVTVTSNTVVETPYKFLEKHSQFANGQRPFTQTERPNNGLDYYSVPVGDSYWVGPEMDQGMMAYQWPYFNANGELEATPLVSHPDNFKNFFETGVT